MTQLIVNLYRATIGVIFVLGVILAIALTLSEGIGFISGIAALVGVTLVVGISAVLISINDHLAAMRRTGQSAGS